MIVQTKLPLVVKLKYLALLILVILSYDAKSQDTNYVNKYIVGETAITVRSVCYVPCRTPVVFINLHDNEQTSVEAASDYLFDNGGKLVRIDNNKERYVSFKYNGTTYTFDPNRIFSREGVAASLKYMSNTVDTNVINEVAIFGNELLQSFIVPNQLVIALHNNGPGELSISKYKKDQADKKHWGKVNINPDFDTDDFILTTDSTIYNKLVEKNINVVWENVALMKDDGSLSIYAGQRNIPYVNIEAEHDHADEQFEMMEALKDIIKEYGKERKEPAAVDSGDTKKEQ